MRVKSGDLIIKSKPFVSKLSIMWRGKRCDSCFEGNPSLKKCTKCKLTFYCSRECQRADWDDHKQECDKLGDLFLQRTGMPDCSMVDFMIMLNRLINKLRRGGDKESEMIGNITRTFDDLISHSSEIRNHKESFKAMESAHAGLERFFRCFLPFDEFLEIAGKMMINLLTIMDDMEIEMLGTGLYLGPSVINHSCQANAYYVFDGPNMIVRSVVDHDQFDISKVSISYIKVLEMKAIRQKSLFEQYYFVCKCTWCKDDAMDNQMMSIRCENTECEQPVFIMSDVCSKCKSPVKPQKKMEALKITESLQESILNAKKRTKEKSKDEALAELTNVMAKAKSLLHPLNMTFIKGADEAFHSCIAGMHQEQALSYGLATLKGYRAYYKDLHPTIGKLYAKIGGVYCYLGNYQEGPQNMQKALDIFTTLFGADHKHTKRIRDLLPSQFGLF